MVGVTLIKYLIQNYNITKSQELQIVSTDNINRRIRIRIEEVYYFVNIS